MNEEERLLEGYKRLTRRSQTFVLAQITASLEMETIARRIALGNLAGIDPLYAERGFAPMGGLREAVNG